MAPTDDYVLGKSLSDSVRGILVVGDMKVADILDLAKELPQASQLHGLDISDDQFPLRRLWPYNYDVVHIQMWASTIKAGDVEPLISHVVKLLKPGGYIQWEEADLVHPVIKGAKAQKFGEKVPVLFRKASDIHNRLQQAILTILSSKRDNFQSFLAQKCTETYLLALAEIFRDLLPLLSECETELQELCALRNKEMVYNWSPIKVLAQKGE
ncbi:hypothetical protein BDV23DRAFT_170844 [Aspergillus alliaceus]|uniref:Methyltransferase type 11 domain-containing protein n=1 Tax=Petromyces alliaceus TaxID=209559 RepID=A0A5N7CF75_PETAA|nr:hypothetical protein BDV23DRAFT_170844 [Aspergillus alliaceus]